MTIGGVRIRAHPLIWPMALLALALGEGERMLTMGAALLLHEGAHILAARWLGATQMELELLPFGGAARLPDLWLLRPGQMLLIAMAGPAVNLLLTLATAASFWWGMPVDSVSAAFLQSNLMLMLFNLLPALPLDGGRAVCALLGRAMSPERACRWGVRLGWVLAALLAGACLAVRRLNLTILMAAVFLLLSGGREEAGARAAALRSLHMRAGELTREGVLPLRPLAVAADAKLFCVLPRLRPRQAHMLFVMGSEGKVLGVVGEEGLRRALEKGENLAVGSLLGGAGNR